MYNAYSLKVLGQYKQEVMLLDGARQRMAFEAMAETRRNRKEFIARLNHLLADELANAFRVLRPAPHSRP
jgi:hypothetical protein